MTAPPAVADPVAPATDAGRDDLNDPAVWAEILSCLERVRRVDPTMRFGQLIDWIGFMAEGETGRTLGNVDDDEFLAALRDHETMRTRYAAEARDA